MNGALVSDLRQSLNFTDAKGIAIPIVILAIMAMLVIPLPSVALDILFTFNIMAGLVIVMISINVHKPLEFSSFPLVLLLATVLRLSLNVASTRVVLIRGHEGPDAAGNVIASFGEFVIALETTETPFSRAASASACLTRDSSPREPSAENPSWINPSKEKMKVKPSLISYTIIVLSYLKLVSCIAVLNH